jgi:hypothetical protein
MAFIITLCSQVVWARAAALIRALDCFPLADIGQESLMKKILMTALFLLSSFTSFKSVSACTCGEYFTPPCAAYWRSDAVFIGTVLKVVETRRGPIHFRIEKSFKGITDKEITVNAFFSSCYERSSFKVKEKYLVYVHKARDGGWDLWPWPCARFMPVASADDDLDYINKVMQKKVSPSITGMLDGLSVDDLKMVKVNVIGEQVNLYSSIDTRKGSYPGRYSVNVPKAGIYRVRFLIPFEAALDIGGLEYTATIVENQCDYRELHLARVTKPGK